MDPRVSTTSSVVRSWRSDRSCCRRAAETNSCRAESPAYAPPTRDPSRASSRARPERPVVVTAPGRGAACDRTPPDRGAGGAGGRPSSSAGDASGSVGDRGGSRRRRTTSTSHAPRAMARVAVSLRTVRGASGSSRHETARSRASGMHLSGRLPRCRLTASCRVRSFARYLRSPRPTVSTTCTTTLSWTLSAGIQLARRGRTRL